MSKKILSFKNVTKRYDKRGLAGINNVSFDLYDNEILSIIGPSGAGKTSLIKAILKEIKIDEGEIAFTDPNIVTSYVKQQSNLDNELTLFENLMRELTFIDDLEKRENQIRTTLQSLEITGEINKRPSELSQGQMQRAIIACALAKNPKLIIFDEPFAHLDTHLKKELLKQLFDMFKDKDICVLWVTHDTTEALQYSKRVMILNHGKVEQIDKPQTIYKYPANFFSANFLGKSNCLIVNFIEEKDKEFSFSFCQQTISTTKNPFFQSPQNKEIMLIIRPEHIHITEDKTPFKGKITQINFLGDKFEVEIKVKDFSLIAYAHNFSDLKVDQKVYLSIDFNKGHYLHEV